MRRKMRGGVEEAIRRDGAARPEALDPRIECERCWLSPASFLERIAWLSVGSNAWKATPFRGREEADAGNERDDSWR